MMGTNVVKAVDNWLADQISGPPKLYRSYATSVTILWEIMEGQSGLPPDGYGIHARVASV
jgi:hypothetical protein